ncbi:hypothetical protein HDU76_007324 [Blyttiomyces sp. JEL0837]|nr:hypothetical protein HDU76_007324 [Blyttiomyces sp. JEL0837]
MIHLIILSFASFLLAAILFTTSFAATDGCIALKDRNSTFIGTVDPNLGSTFRSFYIARDKCINDPKTGFLTFVTEVLPNGDNLNVTEKTETTVNGLDFSAYLTVDVKELIPTDPKEFTSPTITNTITSLNNSIQTSSYQTLQQQSNTTIIRSSLSQLQTSLNSLQSLYKNDFQTFIGLFVVYVNGVPNIGSGNGVGLKPADFNGFFNTVGMVNGNLSLALGDLNLLDGLIAEVFGTVMGMSGALSWAQTAPLQLSSSYSQVITIVTDFADESQRNLTEEIPSIKSRIIGIAGDTMASVDANLECKTVMLDINAFEQQVCTDFVLAYRPPKMKFSHKAMGSRSGSGSSSLVFASSMTLGGERSAGKKFGKADPAIHHHKHADETIPEPDPSNPEWQRSQSRLYLGSVQTLNEPAASLGSRGSGLDDASVSGSRNDMSNAQRDMMGRQEFRGSRSSGGSGSNATGLGGGYVR